MRPFEFFAPGTVAEALALLNRYQENVAVIAGGTDLILELNERKTNPAVIVDISKLGELDYIRAENGVIRIGAITRFAELAASELLKEKVSILHSAASTVGSPQIRNLGTLGGNIVTSSVGGDGLAACVTLDADVTMKSVRGERTMKLDDFLAGEGAQKRNALAADELLTEISFPVPDTRHTATAFYKLAKRKQLAISAIAGGFVVKVDDNGVCTYARMRAGALGVHPMPFEASEQYLVGKKFTYANALESLPLMGQHVMDVNKGRASAIYKKDAVQGVYKKLFADALHQLQLEEVPAV